MSDDIRIEIEGEEPAAARKIETAAEVENRQLRHALARSEAEKSHLAQAARVQIADREFDTIVSGIAAAQAEIAQTEQAQARAWEDGRFADAAKFQSANSIAAARLVELEGAKAHLEYRRQNQQHQQYVQQQQPQLPADPVEAMAANSSPRSAAWIREHRDLVSSDRGRAKVFAAHNDALSEGHTPDSDSYFDHVNKFVGGRNTARASRNGIDPKDFSGRGPTVKLSAAQYKAATDGSLVYNSGPKRGQPLGVTEYARRLLAQKQQGLLDKLD
jgi:hypothetical protein